MSPQNKNLQSLKLSDEGKRRVEIALTDKSWTTEDLAEATDVSRPTATNFRCTKRVSRKNFVKFCNVLELSWTEVAEGDSSIIHIPSEHAQGSLTRQNSELDENKIRLCCRQKILSQYGRIRLLGDQLVSIEDLYVDICFLDRQPSKSRVSPATMAESFDLRGDRLGLGESIRRNPGFEIAEQHQKLVIYGRPGSGKTTFLKHLAINWCEDSFHPDLIAVFIEFRRIRGEKWELLEAISKELETQNSDSSKKLLNNGRLLILMDGFDEIPNENLRSTIQEQIESISQIYHKNHFILTCRTQVLNKTPDNFTSVEIAEFSVEQVEDFAFNWFKISNKNRSVIDAKNGTHQNFIQAIEKNPALKELATTPVLLELMCMVFKDRAISFLSRQ